MGWGGMPWDGVGCHEMGWDGVVWCGVVWCVRRVGGGMGYTSYTKKGTEGGAVSPHLAPRSLPAASLLIDVGRFVDAF